MKKRIISIYMVIGMLIFAVIPTVNILINTYKWQLSQPEFIEGGIETILFIASVYVLWRIIPRHRKFIFFIFTFIYLSVYGVIIPVTITLLYMEALLLIGCAVRNLIVDNENEDIIFNFLSGISVWGCSAIILSLIGHGSFIELRIMTLLLSILSFYIIRKKDYKGFFNRILNVVEQTNSRTEIILFLILAFILLVAFVKSNAVSTYDYDSLWYGLRPEYVLVGENSFYDNLGMSSFVHYYPKLQELLFIPVSNLGDFSFIICMNVWIYALLMVTVSDIIVLTITNIRVSRYAILGIVFSIPAMAGIAATAKPDILGMLLCSIGLKYFLSFIMDKNVAKIPYSLLALFECTGTKLTYLLWGGILFVIEVISVLYYIKKNNNKLKECLKCLSIADWTITLSGIVFVLGVHYRTYKLTGYPIYPTALSIFEKLGFRNKEFMVSSITKLRSSVDTNAIERIVQLMFSPQYLEHIIMLWTTNISFFLLFFTIIVLLGKKLSFTSKNVVIGILMITNLVAFIYCVVSMSVPDGNYFIFPIVVIIVVCLHYIKNDTNIQRGAFSKLVYFMFLLSNLLIMFVSHPSWAYGTQRYSYDIVKNNFDSDIFSQKICEDYGLSNIAAYMESNLNGKKIIISGDLQYSPLIASLPGRVEDVQNIWNGFFSDSGWETYEGFKNNIEKTNTKAFIVTESENEITPYINQYINENGVKDIVFDVGATMYVVE